VKTLRVVSRPVRALHRSRHAFAKPVSPPQTAAGHVHVFVSRETKRDRVD
jgi:hypothetical protein